MQGKEAEALSLLGKSPEALKEGGTMGPGALWSQSHRVTGKGTKSSPSPWLSLAQAAPYTPAGDLAQTPSWQRWEGTRMAASACPPPTTWSQGRWVCLKAVLLQRWLCFLISNLGNQARPLRLRGIRGHRPISKPRPTKAAIRQRRLGPGDQAALRQEVAHVQSEGSWTPR